MSDVASDEFEVQKRTGKDWLFNLMTRELESRDQGEAALQLKSLLRLDTKYVSAENDRTKLEYQMSQRLTEYEVRYDGANGELISWYIDFLAVEGDTSMPEKEAQALAERVALPPEEAKLEESGYVSMGDRDAFMSRWEHYEQGLLVEGDYIQVLINAKIGQPFSYTRVWRQPDFVGTK